jgi:hypothetical protein
VSAPILAPRQRPQDDATAILSFSAVPPAAREVQSPQPAAGVPDSRQLIAEIVRDGGDTE